MVIILYFYGEIPLLLYFLFDILTLFDREIGHLN